MLHLRIDKLSKGFGGVPVLRGIDLAVHSGELLAILGASGSGKTTLLRLICGFERPDAGSIEISGRIITDPRTHLSPEQRQIGYVAQDGALFPHLSVADNIVFGLPRQLRRKQYHVFELLELVGLSTTFATRAPQSLSGGEQQRVALARALAPSPKLVLLDEPFSSLDAASRVETRATVAKALAAAGATTLLVTHDQSEALSMGNEVAVLQEGRLKQVSDPVTLYRRPITADLALFVGEAILLPGTSANGYAVCALGRLKLAAGAPEGQVKVMVRPEQIKLSVFPGPGVRGRVQSVTFHGRDAGVQLSLADQENGPLVFARIAGYAMPHIGVDVDLSVDGEVIAFPAQQAPKA